MRILTACAAALLVAGCVDTNSNLASNTLGGSGSSSPRPKTIVVSDFVVSQDVLLIDRGYTARLERKIGAFPTHERKPRTMDRVNDEIVASIVATLREAGLDAQPGAEEGLRASSDAVIINGRLRPSSADAKKNEAGIGGGKSNVTADMTMSTFSSLGKRELLSFSAQADAKLPSGKAASTSNSEISTVLASLEGAQEKLSSDVEAAARKIGRAAGEKIVAYAKVQGWLNKADGENAVAHADTAKPASAKPKPAAKPEAKPAEATPSDSKSEIQSPDDVASEPADGETDMVKLPAPKPKKKPAA
ncbi:hypothetical protein [Undibacter mobilis]|uniref:DUF4410 domain-containing protein n=1 Tax=Undibacter mobilis TaxID=2292256 RepID=A0A371BC70_9BRAD|nr:hypothetical protein [Undibacter mobilis]RDV05174.1 hypothetical protein DXH78_11720 [Undibacter mobilis]